MMYNKFSYTHVHIETSLSPLSQIEIQPSERGDH